MKIENTKIAGVHIVTGDPRGDHRGMFMRLFCAHELEPAIGHRKIEQINFSRTEAAGAIRGMHFQKKPHAETKMIRCVKGRVFDVAVDLRRGSPTFLQWHAEELSVESTKMIIIPEGCAHGFQVLEPGSEMLYLHTAFYEPSAEGGVAWNDPALGIGWPLPVSDMSARDTGHPPITKDFAGLDV